MRSAVIGIGSNSLRLLVAEKVNERWHTIFRDREGLRVFASLDTQLNISANMIQNACESVNRMKSAAQLHGAQSICLFATSAVRDARNQQTFSDAIFRETGLTLDICSGETEAELSFLGATEGMRSGMIDIGGGSTEIVIGEKDQIEFATSLQAGAVRLFRESVIRSVSDAHHVKETVIRLLTPYQPQIRQFKTPTVWVGVGGTMTAAASCVQGIPWDAGYGIHGFQAKQSAIRNALESLAQIQPELRKNIPTIPPDRADIVVHGFAILLGCMEALDIDTIKISEKTNLDGYLMRFTADE